MDIINRYKLINYITLMKVETRAKTLMIYLNVNAVESVYLRISPIK